VDGEDTLRLSFLLCLYRISFDEGKVEIINGGAVINII